nr:MAG TPA: Pre-mRNA-splicing factor [Caudoviricetes sp.]
MIRGSGTNRYSQNHLTSCYDRRCLGLDRTLLMSICTKRKS